MEESAENRGENKIEREWEWYDITGFSTKKKKKYIYIYIYTYIYIKTENLIKKYLEFKKTWE